MKINEAEKKIDVILKENDLTYSYEFSFPMYRILPDEVKLALSVLEKNGLKVRVILKEKVKK